MVWFRNAVGLTLVAGVALIVPNLPAHAAKGTKGRPQGPQQASAPQDARREQQILRAIRYNSQLLAHVNRNIDLSRMHIERTLPGLVNHVGWLLDAMLRLSPNDPRVDAFVQFAMKRQ